MSFEQATRQNIVALPGQPFAAGQKLSFTLPKVGLLARLWLALEGTMTMNLGGGSATTPEGGFDILDWVSLKANSGTAVVDVSGLGLKTIKDLTRINSQDGASVPVANGANTWFVPYEVPVMVNPRDPIGLINLQNPQTQLALEVLCGQPSNAVAVAGGASITAFVGTVTPILEFFTIPANEADFPNVSFLHQWLEKPTPVSGTGDTYVIHQTGNIYMRIAHKVVLNGAKNSNDVNSLSLKYNQSEIPYVIPRKVQEFIQLQRYGKSLGTGIFAFDFASAGHPLLAIGQGATRDFINSANITELNTVINIAGGAVLGGNNNKIVTLTEQLIPMV